MYFKLLKMYFQTFHKQGFVKIFNYLPKYVVLWV